MPGIPPEPGPYHQAPVMELPTCSLCLADVCHDIYGACRDGPGSDPRLHRIHGRDHYLQQVRTASPLLIAGMFLTAAASMGFVVFLFLPRVLAALGKNATLTGRTGIWVGYKSNRQPPNLGTDIMRFGKV